MNELEAKSTQLKSTGEMDTRIYWENRLSQKWGLHGVGHVSYGNAYNKYLYRVRRSVFLRHVKALPIQLENMSVLDIGSGTGFWVKIWKSLGVESVTASDLTSVAVEKLRGENPGIDAFQLDISDIDKCKGISQRYDIISAIDVTFHITSDSGFARALENCASLLKPKGYLIISENFVHWDKDRSFHQVSRTLSEITKQLHHQQLCIVKRVPMFVLMNTPLDTKSSTPLTLWRFAMAPVKLIPPLGEIYGALLFPLELFLTRFIKESPSTELMICQKC